MIMVQKIAWELDQKYLNSVHGQRDVVSETPMLMSDNGNLKFVTKRSHTDAFGYGFVYASSRH